MFGQVPQGTPCQSMTASVKGPVDLNCGGKYSQMDDGCTLCLNTQNIANSYYRLDSGYMWTRRILPSLAVGAIVGLLIGRRLK